MANAALDKRLKTLASMMRNDMTDAERKLWFLCLQKASYKFRRQKVIEGFIADFYCDAAKLVIELDGSQHYSDYGKTYDQWRSGIIEERGVRVLRFSNGDIYERFVGVKRMIAGITELRAQELDNTRFKKRR